MCFGCQTDDKSERDTLNQSHASNRGLLSYQQK